VAIPEDPTLENIKPVLMSLPVPPLHPILRAGVPNRNGVVYSYEVVAKACEQAQEQVRSRTLLVHMPHEPGGTRDLTNVVGLVEHAELDHEGALRVQVKFIKPEYEPLLPLMRFSAEGMGAVVNNLVTGYQLHCINVSFGSPAHERAG
jgi:hypothetical protein